MLQKRGDWPTERELPTLSQPHAEIRATQHAPPQRPTDTRRNRPAVLLNLISRRILVVPSRPSGSAQTQWRSLRPSSQRKPKTGDRQAGKQQYNSQNDIQLYDCSGQAFDNAPHHAAQAGKSSCHQPVASTGNVMPIQVISSAELVRRIENKRNDDEESRNGSLVSNRPSPIAPMGAPVRPFPYPLNAFTKDGEATLFRDAASPERLKAP